MSPDFFLLLLEPLLLLRVPFHLGFCPVLAKLDLYRAREAGGTPGSARLAHASCPSPPHRLRWNPGLRWQIRVGHQACLAGREEATWSTLSLLCDLRQVPSPL